MSRWITLFQDAPEVTLAPGQTLFRQGDAVRSVFAVRAGHVALERALSDGGALTLHRAGAGTLLAEASLFSDVYHCDAVAREGATLVRMDRRGLLGALRAEPDALLDLFAAQSRILQAQRARIEILRLRRLGDRLDAWLALNGPPPAGGWVQVADAIGVTPAALYRELSRRRRGG